MPPSKKQYWIVHGGKLSIKNVHSFLSKSYDKNLSDNGDYLVDHDLSDGKVQVYKHQANNHAVVVHRGTDSLRDWLTNAKYALGLHKHDARFRHSIDIQQRAENKYGAENISTLGHSLGSALAREAGKNSKEVIGYNGAETIADTSANSSKNTMIRTKYDPVSIHGRNAENVLTIPEGDSSSLISRLAKNGLRKSVLGLVDAHKTDHLKSLPQDLMVGADDFVADTGGVVLGGKLHRWK